MHIESVSGTSTVTRPATAECRRGPYDEIIGIAEMSAAQIVAKFSSALPREKCEFDRYGRGEAMNLDLYGYDAKQEVAVIQIRHSERQYKKGYLKTHKDYVLCGSGEITGRAFRHPVGAAAVRAAIRKDPDDAAAAVRGAQRWMWSLTEKQLALALRQGDVVMVPYRGTPVGGTTKSGSHIVADSHEIRAQKIIISDEGCVFAFAPALYHSKNQHAPTYADNDLWYSVRVADVEAAWPYSRQIRD